jgi:hypothetical protein
MTPIYLDDYEIANLWHALELIATSPDVGPMNTGDWVRQIQAKLPSVEHQPNSTHHEQEYDLRRRRQ